MRRSDSSVSTLAVLAMAPCLAGCFMLGPDYVPPKPDVPDKWHQEITEGLAEGEASIHTWWRTLGDPAVEDLVSRAAKNNKDVRIAFTRVKQASAVWGIAAGERFPDLDGTGFLTRFRESEGIVGVTIPPLSRTDTIGGLGVDASWEIDVFGRIRRSVESASTGFQASTEAYRDVLVVLFAEVASTYVDIRTLQARIKFLSGNIENQQGSLKLTKDRFEAKIAPELDVRQAELNLARTESALPTLRELLARSIYRLGVLLGEHPGKLHEELKDPKDIPAIPEQALVGIPMDLVRQRPDLRQAERNLASQTARIGVATADLYPRFSLFGAFAYEANADLFDAGNQAWSFGPAFRWNLFDGGRVLNSIALEKARTEEALAQYEQVVLSALEEVEGAMVAYKEERKRREMLARSATAAEQSVGLVKTLYRNGLTNFQNVLDSEQSLFLQQDQLADSQGRVVKNLIRLYRALGGGWNPDTADKKISE